ncbi:MAG: hypothetical protein QM570_15460 [Planctomycetota bacterium]|jgi:hypothetical protein|nr:hypothetical protein [Planctomycetota bacterium]
MDHDPNEVLRVGVGEIEALRVDALRGEWEEQWKGPRDAEEIEWPENGTEAGCDA